MLKIPILSNLRKEKTKLEESIQKGFDLNIKEIKEENIVDREGYIITKDNLYKKILKVNPINTDFFNNDDLYFVSNIIRTFIDKQNRVGIYIQKEPVDYNRFIKNQEKIRDKQDNIIASENQNEVIKYIKDKADKLKTTNSFYIVLEDDKIERLNQNVKETTGILQSTALLTNILTKQEILNLLGDRLNRDLKLKYKKLDDILSDNIINYKGLYQQLNNIFHKQLVINSYPENTENYLWLKDLFRLDENINIALILNKESNSEIRDSLDRKINSIHFQKEDLKKESQKQELERQEESAKKILNQIASGSVTVQNVLLIIDVFANSENELRDKVNIVKNLLSSLSIKSFEPLRKGFMPFLATMPILANNEITKKYTWNLLSSDIASLIIFDDSEFFKEDGIVFGYNPQSRKIYAFNPFSQKDFLNPHILILGKSGSGKTFFILYLVERLKAVTDHIIRLDIAGVLGKGDTKKYVISANGELIINPFYIRLENKEYTTQEKSKLISEKIFNIITFFKNIGDFKTKDIPVLEELIRLTFMFKDTTENKSILEYNEATLQDFKYIASRSMNYILNLADKENNELKKKALNKKYETIENILEILNPFTDGVYSKLFNGFNNIDFDYKDVTIDFSQMPEELRKPVYNLLLKDLWQFCIKDGTRDKNKDIPSKVIVIDEEHELLNERETLEYISTNLQKQGRKYKVAVINATQEIRDVKDNPEAQSILNNCQFKFLFKLGDLDNEEAKKIFSLKNEEMKIIKGNNVSSGKLNASEKGKGIMIIDEQHFSFKSEATLNEIKLIDNELYKELTKMD